MKAGGRPDFNCPAGSGNAPGPVRRMNGRPPRPGEWPAGRTAALGVMNIFVHNYKINV